MGDAGHAIEYFATLGRRKTLICKTFQRNSSSSSSSSSQNNKNPAVLWNEAITDIVVIQAGETIPEEMRDWEMVQASVDNNPTGMNTVIAFRRRSSSQRLDHITKVSRSVTLSSRPYISLYNLLCFPPRMSTSSIDQSSKKR